MRIVLIGFSGTGKSHWSKLLAERKGYHHLCCDDLIEDRLRKYLPHNASGINAVAEWMGQPYDARFKENERRYLQCEIEVLAEILSKPVGYYPERTILDTTGSVIYTGKRLTTQLRSFGTIIYLEVTPEVLTEMFRQYMRDPKPVIWGASFARENDESPTEALRRCYPHLLEFRQNRYEALADVRLGYTELRQSNFGVIDFLSAAGIEI
jgi:shikimate kinase